LRYVFILGWIILCNELISAPNWLYLLPFHGSLLACLILWPLLPFTDVSCCLVRSYNSSLFVFIILLYLSYILDTLVTLDCSKYKIKINKKSWKINLIKICYQVKLLEACTKIAFCVWRQEDPKKLWHRPSPLPFFKYLATFDLKEYEDSYLIINY
jgi:hypothetical protein